MGRPAGECPQGRGRARRGRGGCRGPRDAGGQEEDGPEDGEGACREVREGDREEVRGGEGGPQQQGGSRGLHLRGMGRAASAAAGQSRMRSWASGLQWVQARTPEVRSRRASSRGTGRRRLPAARQPPTCTSVGGRPLPMPSSTIQSGSWGRFFRPVPVRLPSPGGPLGVDALQPHGVPHPQGEQSCQVRRQVIEHVSDLRSVAQRILAVLRVRILVR